MQKDILLITPPFTQLNTPYPATAYLKGFLNTKQIPSFQMDLGIEVILNLFTKKKLQEIFDLANQNKKMESINSKRIYALKSEFLKLENNINSYKNKKIKTKIVKFFESELFIKYKNCINR